MKNKLYLSLAFIFSISLANAAQVCRDYIPDNTPNIRYTVHGNGTVTDDRTKLMWKVCSEGQTWDTASCTGTTTGHNWQQALQIPKDLNAGNGYAGYTDWRLPNINELVSIMNSKCYSPAINEIIFPNTLTSWFWSSSLYASGNNNAWFVSFEYGYYYGDERRNYFRVRLVRGGQ